MWPIQGAEILQCHVMGDSDEQKLAEVQACLNDKSLGLQLRENVQRETAMYTVGLLPLSQKEKIEPGATGTLVSFLNSYYILTAAHVWYEGLKNALRIGVTLKEEVDHKYLLDPMVVEPFGPPRPTNWNQWGPDIVLLDIPPVCAAEIMALGRGGFYNLSKPKPLSRGGYLEERLLMGLPEILAKYEGAHADLYLNGMFLASDAPTKSRGDFDYVDLDVGYQGALEDFGGVSGGGLWHILYYKSAETGEIKWFKFLEGVAFYHLPVPRAIRCHGPQSIGTALGFLFGPVR